MDLPSEKSRVVLLAASRYATGGRIFPEGSEFTRIPASRSYTYLYIQRPQEKTHDHS